jgi:hypothetical protein
MSMAGGTWVSQNKVLPGVYINVQSQPNVVANVGNKGVVAIAKALSWGALGEVVEITPGQDVAPVIGYNIATAQAQFLREMMRGTDSTSCPTKILLYRYAGSDGVKAGATLDSLVVTARYEGARGNDISIAIIADPDNSGVFEVQTIVDGAVVGTQTASVIGDLADNAWVTFSGTAATALVANAGTALTGGVDPTVTAADDAAFLTAIEPYTFDIIAYDGESQTVADAYVAFVTRMNDSVGRKCQLVVGGFTGYNNKYVISANNGVVLADGSSLNARQVVWWLAGAEAGALYYQSLTYAQYPTAVSANPKLTDDQTAAAIAAGQIAFVDDFGIVKVCTDINSKTTVTIAEGAEFKKNRVMRVIMQFCNDTYEHFATNYIGKVDNNADGRALLRAWIIGYLNEMMANNGIQNFTAEDVEVLPGDTIDAVLINVALQPVDSIEKIYMSVTVSVTANA